MNANEIIFIVLFNLTDDICKPFEMFLGTCHPNKINLFAGKCWFNRPFMRYVLQNGGKRCDTNTTTNQYRYFITIPILMTFTKRTI